MLKHSVLIDERLYNEINEYCKANGIKTSEFCNKELRKAIAIEKYGDTPFGKIIIPPPSVHTEAAQAEIQSDTPFIESEPMQPLIEEIKEEIKKCEDEMFEIAKVPSELVENKPQTRKRRL